MKIRIGFVSNSSTSSFICCICDETVSGFSMSLSEADMFECVNGHCMCQEHALEDLSSGEEIDNEDDEDEDEDFDIYSISEKCCPICMYQEFDYGDARQYLKEKYKISEDLVFEEIKKINRRRKKLYDEEYVKYVFEKVGLTDDTFLAAIKEQFPVYGDYLQYEGE